MKQTHAVGLPYVKGIASQSSVEVPVSKADRQRIAEGAPVRVHAHVTDAGQVTGVWISAGALKRAAREGRR
jgi:hypothetical protein